MAAITDLATLNHYNLSASDYFVVHDVTDATDKKVAPFDSSTWTPALNFAGSTSGITYTSRAGMYLNVSGLCWIDFSFVLSSKGTFSASDAATITGLPFTSATGSNPFFAVRWVAMTTSLVNVMGFVATASTAITFRAATAATTGLSTGLTYADFANNSQIFASFVYRIA
jgi:hypothetical protein